MISKIIEWFYKLFGINIKEEEKKKDIIYAKKNFMTQTELKFYKILMELSNDYNVIPQINLATIVKKVNKGYINELFKNIDFAIFDKEFKEVLLLIELNDSSHEQYNRKDRDLKVKKICNDTNLKLMTFYTKYPNEKNYVINRIRNAIANNENLIEEKNIQKEDC